MLALLATVTKSIIREILFVVWGFNNHKVQGTSKGVECIYY